MSTQKNLITLCAAAALTLGLAACGGGGDAPRTTMPDPHPELTLAGVQMAMAVQADTYRISDDLADALEGGDASLLGVDHEEGMTIDIAGLMLTCGVGPCRVTLNDDGTITTTGTIWTAGYMPPPTAEEITAAATAAAATKATAIAAEAAQGATGSPSATLHADAGLGGTNTTDGTAVDTYSMTIERERDMAAEITIADTALAGDDDPKFAQTMDDLGSRNGFANSMHVRVNSDDENGKVEEVVVVSTDIEEPKGVAFAMWQARAADGTLSTPHTLTVRQDGETVDADNPADSISVEAGTENANLPLIMSGSFAAPPAGSSSVTHTFLPAAEDADTVTPGNQPRDAAMVGGTYRGADGTYTCGGTTDCTVTVNDEGEVTAITGTWVFTPDMGATSDQPDYDYLSYGFWLKRTTDADGMVTYNEVETFAESRVPASGDVSAVTGSATYTGGATGVYVRNVFDDGGEIESATSGVFTANASLTATFGQVNDDGGEGIIAPNLLNSVTGEVTGFETLAGVAIDGSWKVELMRSDIASTGTFAGDTTGNGSYSGTFHGPADADTQPHSAVGEFDAVFTNGSVAGGFGVRKDD